MRLLKLGLRFWIALTTVFSFMAGWLMIAHAPKPIQPGSTSNPSSAAALPTLAPLQPLNFSNNGGNTRNSSPFVIVHQPNSFFSSAPVFNTGGS